MAEEWGRSGEVTGMCWEVLGGAGRCWEVLGGAGRYWEVLGGFFVFGDLCPLGEMQKAVKWVEKRG